MRSLSRRTVMTLALTLTIVMVGAGFDSCSGGTPYRQAATLADQMSRTLNSAVRSTYAAEQAGLVSHERVLALDPTYLVATKSLKGFIDFGKTFTEETYTEAARIEAQKKFKAVTNELDKINSSDLPADVRSQLEAVNSDRLKIEKALSQEVTR